MALAIRTEHLERRYPGGQGVADISLDVAQGSIYGFLGPNGAGKTTTIRLLLGLLRPQRGHIELLGKEISAQPDVLSKVGALVEMPSLYRHLTGRENLEVTRRLLDAPVSRIDEVLKLTEMTDAANRTVADYSLGMRQRLGIALALIGKPELLILDEPANGLDPMGIADLRRLLQYFSRELGMTVLISSHLLAEVEQVATHVGVLHEGRLRFQGDITTLRNHAKPQVHLFCDDAQSAYAILQSRGNTVSLAAGGWLSVGATSRDVPQLILQLSGAGLTIHDLKLESATLESSFFNLVDPSYSESA